MGSHGALCAAVQAAVPKVGCDRLAFLGTGDMVAPGGAWGRRERGRLTQFKLLCVPPVCVSRRPTLTRQ